MAARDPETDSIFNEMTKRLEAEFAHVEDRINRRGRRGPATYWVVATALLIGGLVIGLLQPFVGAALFVAAVFAADRAIR